MVKRILIILAFFICFANASLAGAKCKYYSEADVINNVLVNKKEHYTCSENENNPNFLLTFFTDPKYSVAAEQVYTMLYLATIKALGFN